MANAGLEVDLVDAISYTLDNGAIGTMASTGSIKPGQDEQLERSRTTAATGTCSRTR